MFRTSRSARAARADRTTTAGNRADSAASNSSVNGAAGKAVFIMQAGAAISALGTGLVLPFLLIYLHRVRGIPLGQTGLLIAIAGLVSFVAGPAGGALADRFGARRVLVGSAVMSMSAYAALAFVHTAAEMLPVAFLLGTGEAVFYPALAAMFARLAEGAALSRLFATNFVVINAGIGVGGLIAGLVVSVSHPLSFQIVYLADAASDLVLVGMLLAMRLPPAVPSATTARATGVRSSGVRSRTSGSYRQVIADPLFREVFVLSLLLALVGYAEVDSGLPAYATTVLHVGSRTLAFCLVANTAVIVLGQMLILRRLRRVSRTRALLGTAGLTAAAWILLGVVGVLPGHALRAGLVIAFGAVFGLGEMFMAPVIGPMVNDIAPAHLRGRYNALAALAMSMAMTVAPILSTTLISAHLAGVWLGLLVLGCVAVVTWSRRLSARLTPAQNGLHDQAGQLAPGAVAEPVLV